MAKDDRPARQQRLSRPRASARLSAAKLSTAKLSAAERSPPGKPVEATARRSPRRGDSLRLSAEVERLSDELARAREKLLELEKHIERDPLTDVLNRRGFDRELHRALAYAARHGIGIALVYLDLDHFKPVNDRHGHAAGDAVLRAAARALVESVRATDVVARVGGDEFALLLWNIASADVAARTAAIEAAIPAALTLTGKPGCIVGASAGSTMLAAADSAAQALARADAAMYARKAERR